MEKQAKFKELIKQQKSTGLTVKEFCANEGIVPSTFYYWQKKLKESPKGKDFIPLVVKPSTPSVSRRYPKRFEAQTGTNEQDDFLLELVYPNGTRLRIKQDLDLDHLRSLIHLFD